MTRIFIPRDSGALAVGAEAVAQAIAREAAARNLPVEIVRTGSRGLYWLEPMIVIETAIGRIAYGPMTAADVTCLLDAESQAARAARAHPLPGTPDPAHVRALRDHRSALA